MKKLNILFCGGGAAALLAAGYVGVTGIAQAEGGASATAAKVDNFRLASADLESYELYRMKDAKAVVLLTHAKARDAEQIGQFRQADVPGEVRLEMSA